jgi:hypothetical protein
VIAIRVEPDGSVSGTDVVSNTGLSAEFEACTVAAARSAKFGCNPGGTVRVPLNLTWHNPFDGGPMAPAP